MTNERCWKVLEMSLGPISWHYGLLFLSSARERKKESRTDFISIIMAPWQENSYLKTWTKKPTVFSKQDTIKGASFDLFKQKSNLPKKQQSPGSSYIPQPLLFSAGATKRADNLSSGRQFSCSSFSSLVSVHSFDSFQSIIIASAITAKASRDEIEIFELQRQSTPFPHQ